MALKAILDSIDDLPADVQKEYVEKNGKFELQVEGMKTPADVERVQSALVKERNDHRKLKEKFEPLADQDPIKVREILDRVPELEAAATGKLDDTKIETIVAGRINAQIQPLKRELESIKTAKGELDKRIEGYAQKEKSRAINDAVREAAVKSGIRDTAIEDAIILAERVMELGEDGKVTTRDNVGVTPGLDPSVWLTDMQEKRPHWWGETTGGGAKGSKVANGGQPNPFSAEHWNMTEQGKLVTTNRPRAEQMAKLAGTTIGGPKPAAKK